VYNEQECIEGVLDELRATLDASLAGKYEVVLVNDGSSDGTADVLVHVRERWPELKVCALRSNSGQSAAFFAGFRRARAERIVTMDADGQNDPADIPKLLAELASCDCCCGYRADRQDTWSKRYGSKLANGIRNLVLKEDIIDTGCSLKAFRTELTRPLAAWNGMHRFYPSLFGMQGARISQVPVNHRPRAAGTSKYTNWGRLKKTWWDLWSVRWMKKRYVAVEVAEP
jgi:dolichol-phosphate mannosyltransferase